jgi:hypothetical protein
LKKTKKKHRKIQDVSVIYHTKHWLIVYIGQVSPKLKPTVFWASCKNMMLDVLKLAGLRQTSLQLASKQVR